MIEKVKNIIMNADYKKLRGSLLIFSLIAFLVGGAVSALSLKTQIGEVISYHQTYENEHEKSETENREEIYAASKEHDKEHFLESADITKPSMFAENQHRIIRRNLRNYRRYLLDFGFGLAL